MADPAATAGGSYSEPNKMLFWGCFVALVTTSFAFFSRMYLCDVRFGTDFGIDKVTKYHMNAPLYVTVFAWLVNKKTYENMSPTQRKALDDHCTTDWALRAAGPWGEYERAGVAKLEADKNHEVYKLTEAQLGEWRNAAEPVVKLWADSARKAGIDPEAALAELRASVAKYKALE